MGLEKLMPIIGVGADLLGQGLNAITTAHQNKLQRDFANQMYDKQRADALADWNMNNQYNSPQAQMQRLKEAGLNPNMIYGSGGGITTAQSVRGTDTKSINPQAPQFNLGSTFGAYYDTKIKQAQYDNLLEQRKVMAQNQAESATRVAMNLLKQKTGEFDLQLKNELRNNTIALSNTSLEAAKSNVDYIDMKTNTGYDANIRAHNLQGYTFDKILSEIALNKAKTSLVPYDKQLRNAQIENIENNIFWRNRTEPQKIEMGKVLHETGLVKIGLLGEQKAGIRLENALKDAKIKFKEMGFSDNAVENIIKAVINKIK